MASNVKTIYKVTTECPFTGRVITEYRGGNKREALAIARVTGGSLMIFYAPK